ncbi:cytochrome P450 4F3 isoform X2 [Esox lucius]|nr:cytochrome P450 4F3 isoform X2 [Esox lucius]XP_010867497.1 cytochrome P450 4F3 isoform X2 [Esox lucius]XP_019902566.1 cytochrome P450 4F3 isoform X2 [Esox lucius]
MGVVDAVLGNLLDAVLRAGHLLSPLLSLSVLLQLTALVLLLLLLLRVSCLLWSHAQFNRRLSCFSKPPTQSWLMGHLGEMRSTEEGLQAVDRLVRTYKHSCSWFLGPFYSLVRLFHPDYVKPLLLASASITVKDELFYGFLRPWLGQSILLSNGEEWSRRRRLLTPAFHFDILRNYIKIFNHSSDVMHAKWRRLVANGESCLDMFSQISMLTLDSLLKCTFSYNSNCQENSSEYIAAILELSNLIIDRRGRILHHWDWWYWRTPEGRRFKRACDIVHGFTRTVVQERREQLLHRREPESHTEKRDEEEKKKKVVDFIDLLLLSKDEEGQGLSDEDVKAEADTFMFAGHDTTASGISWVLYNLSQNQDYQDRCRAEVNDLLQDRQTEDIEWDDLNNLPFTTMCIKESLRLHSPVSAVTRRYTEDMNVPGGRVIPKGSICLLSIYGIHHNPEVWPDPDVYNPMRFDPENSKGRSSHAFIPFSSGPRNCIGQKFAMAEMRVVVALTLRRFRLTSGPEKVRRLPQVVLGAEGGLQLQLETLDPPQE